MTTAGCFGEDPGIWFEDERHAYDEWLAKAICAKCPIKGECGGQQLRVEGSVSAAMRFGIYGGMTPEERARIAKNASRGARSKHAALTSDEHDARLDAYRTGMDDAALGERFGVARQAIASWRRTNRLPANCTPRGIGLLVTGIERKFEMYKAGKTDREMASALHTTCNSISSWRSRFGLPPNSRQKVTA